MSHFMRTPVIYLSLPLVYPENYIYPKYTHPLNIYKCDTHGIHPLTQNIPPFQHLYATHAESTPPFHNRYPPFFDNYMRYSHNPSLPSRLHPLLYQVGLPDSTPSFQNIASFSTTICDAPRIYPTLLESTLPSQIIPTPPLYATLPEIYPYLQNIPPSSSLYATLP